MAYKAQTHQSFFSYSLARPYPFRWFTPVAIGILVTSVIVFSFINIASNGYTLAVQLTKDPNATLSQDTRRDRWPSFMTTKVRSTCQPHTIPVTTQLFTNNTALTYTLTAVWRDLDGTRNLLPSLEPYQMSILQSCTIKGIDMDLDSQYRSSLQLSYSQWGAKVFVYVTCSIDNHPEGPTWFDLTTLYDYVPNTIMYGEQKDFLGSMFLSRNATARASLYWGESLLSMAWTSTCRELQIIGEKKDLVGRGTITFRRSSGMTANITDPSFFALDFQFMKGDRDGKTDFFLPPQNHAYDIGSLDAENFFPNIWIKADVLAKAAYSTVLTDLGQVDAPHNLLKDPTQLEQFTANFSDWHKTIANALPGPEVQSYATAKDRTGALEVKPSVFVLDYLCQVPRRKAMPSLVVSVLVADLVFLQAVWQIYKLVVEYFLKKRVEDSQWCDGCTDRQEAFPLNERNVDDD